MSLDNKSNSYKMKCSCSKNKLKEGQKTNLQKRPPAALREMADYRRETLMLQEALLMIEAHWMITKRVIVRGIVALMPCSPTLKTISWIRMHWLEIWAHGIMDHVILTSVTSSPSKTFTHSVAPLSAKQVWVWMALVLQETHTETLLQLSETADLVSLTTMPAVSLARFKSR